MAIRGLPTGILQALANRLSPPTAIALLVVAIITAIIWVIDAKLKMGHLIFIYFVPTTFIAIRFGSAHAMFSIIASDLAAAYFLYQPKLSFVIVDTLDMAELLLFTLLAALATKVVSGFEKDSNVKKRTKVGTSRLTLPAANP